MILAASNAVKRELKPLTGYNNPQWLSAFSFMNGFGSESGQRVNADTAISLSTVFNALRLLSETVAQIPVSVYTEENGKRSELKNHRTYPLVADFPNKYMTAFTFNRVMMNHACRYDNAFALIERDGFNRPLSLIPIHPERVIIRVNDAQEVQYEIDGQYLISPINMIHIMDYTEDGIVGKQKISILKETLGNALATDKFVGEFFGKGVNVSGFIKTKKYLKDQAAVDRLKNSFIKAVTGSSFGVGILEEDNDWIPNDVEPEKAQLNETRKVNAQAVAQIWNIPLPLLKMLDNATYNNVEQLDIQFAKYTITPWLVNWEQEYKRKLLSETEKKAGKVYYKHNMNALMRGDMVSRGKFYESGTKTGAFSPNDIRHFEDMNPYDGGDVHVVPSGYQTVEQLNSGEGNGNSISE